GPGDFGDGVGAAGERQELDVALCRDEVQEPVRREGQRVACKRLALLLQTELIGQGRLVASRERVGEAYAQARVEVVPYRRRQAWEKTEITETVGAVLRHIQTRRESPSRLRSVDADEQAGAQGSTEI